MHEFLFDWLWIPWVDDARRGFGKNRRSEEKAWLYAAIRRVKMSPIGEVDLPLPLDISRIELVPESV
jgi:hypothetical protein